MNAAFFWSSVLLLTFVHVATSGAPSSGEYEEYATYMQLTEHCEVILGSSPPQFTKFVLILIDALRIDFVPTILDPGAPPRMSWLETNLDSHGLGMVSVASMPTVTLPRLKGLLSGSVPSFRDYVLNLNAYAFTQDNLVASLAAAGRRLLFFGDDTWGRLFPDPAVFLRSELTSSFFVTDTVTVDSNVTRNVRRELHQLDEWDVLLMHYLGVDHIGHGLGYSSPLMEEKLKEMDSVVKLIFESLTANNESALVVVTGDHGMTNAGNHGGATKEETDTPLIFLSTAPTHQTTPTKSQSPMRRPQIDFTPTIASLLRLPHPGTNRGIVISPVLDRFSEPNHAQLCSLFSNAMQIQNVIRRNAANKQIFKQLREQLAKALQLHQNYLSDPIEIYLQSAIFNYNSFLDSVQCNFVNKNDGENANLAVLSCLLLAIGAVICSLLWLEWQNAESILFIALKWNDNDGNPKNPAYLTSPHSHLIAFLTILANILAMSSTNFIQNEHVFWNILVVGIVGVTFLASARNFILHSETPTFFASLLALILCPLLLQWRITELTSQWGDAPVEGSGDIYAWLMQSDHKAVASGAFLVSLTLMTGVGVGAGNLVTLAVFMSGQMCVYAYRSQTGSLTPILPLDPSTDPNFYAQLVFLHAFLLLAHPLLVTLASHYLPAHLIQQLTQSTPTCLTALSHVLLLLVSLLLDAFTVPVLALSVLLEYLLHRILFTKLSPSTFPKQLFPRLILYLIFAHSSFYHSGNSNSLSTVAVNACFIGLSSYQPAPCTVFMFIATYGTHLFWLFAFFSRLHLDLTSHVFAKSTRHSLLNSILTCLLLVRLAVMSSSLTVSLVLRHHPYIWSVLSPKLLYELLYLFLHFTVVLLMSTIFIPSFL